MQCQDDDASYSEEDHAPTSTPEKVEFQVGNYCLVNYKEEFWSGQKTKIISNSVIRVKCYEKVTAPAGSTWRWPKKPDEQDYHIMDIKHKTNTPECTWIHQKLVVFTSLINFSANDIILTKVLNRCFFGSKR